MIPALELSDVIKDYRGLRPLRIESLTVAAGASVAVIGLDQISAEVLVNLVTGYTLPDRGVVRVFGRSTADITDSTEWLSLVDRFGILSDRAVLLEGLSTIQNLAIPFSLEVEPPSEDVRARAAAIAREVGLDAAILDTRIADSDQLSRVRVRLGRALALDPQVLLLEHPTSELPRDRVESFGRQLRAVVEGRGAAALAMTADPAFAHAVAQRVLTLSPATGRLTEGGKGWFPRLRRA